MAANDNVAIAAAFFSGLYILQNLNFCWTGSFPTLLRFGISPSKIGLFIGDTGASMNYWVSWGILLSLGLSFCNWAGDTAPAVSFIAPIFCTVIYTLAFAYTWYVRRFSGEVAFSLTILVLLPIGGLFAIGILDALKGKAAKDESQKPLKEKLLKQFVGKYVCPIVSCLAAITVFMTRIRLFRICLYAHGNEGVRSLYLWLCMSALAHQFDSSLIAKVAGGKVAWYFFAMELSYFIIPFVHGFVGLFGRCFEFGVEYGKLFWHLMSICLLTFVGVILWFVHIISEIVDIAAKGANNVFSYTSANQDAGKSLVRCLSPGIMGIIGMGSIFWLFPVVWPFMVCHYSHFEFVMLLGPGLGSFATLIPWILNDGHELDPLTKGNQSQSKDHPLNKFRAYFTNWNGYVWQVQKWQGGTSGSLQDDSSGSDAPNWLTATTANFCGAFHATWGILLLIVLLFKVITSCIHYPRCFVARNVLHSRWAVVFGSLFFFFTQLFKAVGLTGCFANAIKLYWKTTDDRGGTEPTHQFQPETFADFAHSGTFVNISFSFSLFHLTGALFTAQAYSVGYGSFKCAVDSGCSWPTQGVGGVRSFFWWLNYGLKKGNRRFWSLAQVDIVSVIS